MRAKRMGIVVCGGREVTLRGLQPLMFAAGANGILTGDYLTTPGQAIERDLELIADLGLEIWRDPPSPCGEIVRLRPAVE